jgi:hypothetical protein
VSLPAEIKIALSVVGAGAVLFIAVGIAWDNDALRLPIGAGILAVAVCVGLFFRLRFVRVITLVVVTLLALVHLLIALSDAPPWWVRIISGVLTAAYIYAAVAVNTQPARTYLESTK